jgi:hypothetical protein
VLRVVAILVVSILLVVVPQRVISAQDADSSGGTLLICLRAGEGIGLHELTSQQVADIEAGSGRRLTRAHPQTGTCADPAGLPVDIGWTPSSVWRCTPTLTGEWSGPKWILTYFLPSGSVHPEPSFGRCPQPWAEPSPNISRTQIEWAAATAAYLTELEVAGDYDRLYAWLHPDAQAVVPRAALYGWYRDVYAQRPPVAFFVDGVRLTEWTWDVTGQIYLGAAEITFRQRYADGEEDAATMWLVRDKGAWRWFFGRSRASLDDLIARYVTAAIPPMAFRITDLGTGQGNWSKAHAINDHGEVLWTWGTSHLTDSGRLWVDYPHTSIRWRDGDLDLGDTRLMTFPAQETVLLRDNGREWRFDPAVGVFAVTPGPRASDPTPQSSDAGHRPGHSLVQGGTAIPLPAGVRALDPVASNATGYTVGNAYLGDAGSMRVRAFIATGDQITILASAPNGHTSMAHDVNDAGVVVGDAGVLGSGGLPESGHAFLYGASTGVMVDLGTLPGDEGSTAHAINNQGHVVGCSHRLISGTFAKRAMLYDQATARMWDLNDLIPPQSGWILQEAIDINNNGHIVGQGIRNGELHAFLLTPTRRSHQVMK